MEPLAPHAAEAHGRLAPHLNPLIDGEQPVDEEGDDLIV